MTDYLSLSIKEINKKLKNKEIKVIDLVNESFYKIEQNKHLNAFITLNKEEAIKQAKILDTKEVDNILFGIPISIKDCIVTKDLITTAGSEMLKNFIPTYDATVIEKIKSKNMIIIGKTNMDAFNIGGSTENSDFGNVLNYLDNTKIPGGSSGGSAVSVISNMVSLSLGSDTGGSVRQPASYSNIVGMKPTYGRISRYGLISSASSLEQIGIFSKNVYENSLLLNLISGFDNKDLTSINEEIDFNYSNNIENKKIAIPNIIKNLNIDKPILEAFNKTLELLSKNNTIEYVDIKNIEYISHIYRVITSVEISSNFARYDSIRYGTQLEKDFKNLDDFYKKNRCFNDETKQKILLGTYFLKNSNKEKYYYKSLNIRKKIQQSITDIFKNYDYILTPTTTCLPKNFNETEDFNEMIFTAIANLTMIPALSLPIKKFIGIQILADKFKEKEIYQLASYIEKEVDINE